MNPLNTIATLRRTDFVGMTDKFSKFGSAAIPTKMGLIQNAISGKEFYDVKGNLLNENLRDLSLERVNRYNTAWRFYEGKHYIQEWDDGEKKAVFNFCGPIVDKAVEWLVAEGMHMTAADGNEPLAELLNIVWESNNLTVLMEKAGQFGAVTGDAFFYVTVNTKDLNGKELPRDEWTVCITVLNPAYVMPFWDERHPESMSSCLIQYPLSVVTKDGNAQVKLHTIYITPKTWEVWIDDESMGEQSNPFGRMNVVHVPNLLKSNSLFGRSDLEPVISVNEEFNGVANSVRKIIKYHAEPTTLIYGARVSSLEKGAKKVWSNLPGEGKSKVENLEMKGDLTATYAYMERLENLIYKLSETPKQAFETSETHVSNTSGIAIQMLYQPLIEKTRRRQSNYRKGIKEMNSLIIIAHRDIIKLDLSELVDNEAKMMETDVCFSSPLPKDEQTELDQAMKKVEAGIWSKAEAIRRVAGIKNNERLMLELAADSRATLALAYETARATGGKLPNFSSVFLSSPFLTEDLLDVSGSDSPIEE